MMKYEVRWGPAAENELASLWLDSDDRQTITDAAMQIDELLAAFPQDRGESRFGDIRILFVSPLGVLFQVDEQNRRVQVIAVWQIRTR